MSYKVGRRFEYHVVYKLKEFGFEAKRVTLSGKRSDFYPSCDVVVKVGSRELKGKLKTTKKKEYVSIPLEDFSELLSGFIDFLCFGFFRSKPFFIVNDFDSSLDFLEKVGEKYISFSRKDVDFLPKNIFVNKLGRCFLLLSLEDFVDRLRKLKSYPSNH